MPVASPGSRTGQSSWPAEARRAMVTLETMFPTTMDRRSVLRDRYRVVASFIPTGLQVSAEEATLYTRDVNRWALGFICRHPLHAGTRGTLQLPMPDGTTMFISAVVRRCREYDKGWHDGMIHFAQEQQVFAEMQDDQEWGAVETSES
jgi:hypothetical protein